VELAERDRPVIHDQGGFVRLILGVIGDADAIRVIHFGKVHWVYHLHPTSPIYRGRHVFKNPALRAFVFVID